MQDLVAAAQRPHDASTKSKSKRRSADGTAATDSAPAELQVGSVVKCTVLIQKTDAQCLIVRVQNGDGPLTLGFISTCDYNVQHGNIKRSFKRDQEISAVVSKLPEASVGGSNGGRLFLTTSLQLQAGGLAARRPREFLDVGAVVTGVVEKVRAQHVCVKLPERVAGFVSACDVVDLKTVKVCLSPVVSSLFFFVFMLCFCRDEIRS
jgi:ribosomal protein S1